MTRLALTLCLLCNLALPFEAGAQVRGGCPDGRVASIRVHPKRVFSDSVPALLSPFYAAANWLHVETRESVIRRELLLKEGSCFDRLRLEESERLLRDFAFLQSANVQATSRPDGDYDITVETKDDWSLRLEPRFELGAGPAITGLGLAERNLAGSGRQLYLRYVDLPGRDEVGARFYDPQLFGTRWNLALDAVRTESGWFLRETLAYPMVALVGRWAAFEDVLYGERWFRYVLGDGEERNELILPMRQEAAQVGAALRFIGPPQGRATKLTTYGLTVSYERLTYGTGFFRDSASSAASPISEKLAADFASLLLRPRETVRLNLVVGIRGLDFIQRRGLITLRATEDLGIGASADLVLGLANSAFGSADSHFLVGVDLYGGARVAGKWYSLLSANAEGRRDYEAREWGDIFAAVQWTNLFQIRPGHTVVLEGRWSAGWESTFPFQLTLGGPWGLSGFAPHRYPGGARAVARLENRQYLTSISKLVDFGTVAFVDAGEMWSNAVPFGLDSGFRASAGAGLLIAAPAGTRLTYRLQMAAPIDRSTGWDDLVFSLRIQRVLRLESQPLDLQLRRSRDIALRTGVRHLK